MIEKFLVRKYRGNNEWTYYLEEAGVSNFYATLIGAKRFTSYGDAKTIVDSQTQGIYQIDKIFENE